MITSKTASERLRLALPHVSRIKAAYAEYEEERNRYGRSNYCRHGNNVGSWWGPDLMCGYCEDSEPMEVYWFALAAADREIAAARSKRDRIHSLYELLIQHPQYRQFIKSEMALIH